MCGVPVALRRHGATAHPVDEVALRTALDRRGPDDHHAWHGERASFWSSRLVLWDEGDARQPWVDDDLVAGFNGELFNLDDLREVLGRPGASEVEVLARGLATRGADFLRLVDGQFAGVVVDRRTGNATAFRDRFGICPLYWADTEHGVVLASSLTALRALAPAESRALTPEGLAAVVCEWAVPAPGSPWRGVQHVVPGTAVELVDGSARHTTTWAGSPETGWPERGGGTDELVGLLRRAVAARTRSVGSIAVSLSGGVDSTVVAALASECGVTRSFGLVVPGEDVVERRQHHVADRLGLDHDVLTLEPADLVDALVRFVATRRVPLLRLGPVGMASLAGHVRRSGTTAVLCGEGADELFSGYDSYRVLAARAGLFGPVEELDWALFGEPEMGVGRGETWARSYWRGLVAVAARADMRRSRVLAPVLTLLGPDVREAVEARWAVELDPAALPNPLDARRAEDVRDLLEAYLLIVQGDHSWMEEAVEQRPPWLSNDVASWALNRPASAHVSVSQGKLPVRAVVAHLAAERPELSGLDFDKSAYRVDAGTLLRDPGAWEIFSEVVASCPSDLLDVPGVLRRLEACTRVGRVSEVESMLLVLAASLGVLGAEVVS